jgi:hypothetical protein
MTKIKKIDHIYVICDIDKEKDKYEKWINWKTFNNIDDEYITFYCYKWGTELTDEDLNKYSYDDGTLVRMYPFRANFPLKRSEISLSINFLNVFKMGLDKKQDTILVFESDAILHPDFIKKMDKVMNELSENYSVWHMLSIGAGMNRHYDKIKKNKSIYKVNSIRCLDSFVISRIGMKFITDNLKKVNIPIDEHLNLFAVQNKLMVLWLEPTIVVQGSQTGINLTTIRIADSIYVKESDCSWLKDVKFK